MHFLLMVDRVVTVRSVEGSWEKRRVTRRRAQCPVSSSDGTARPGHMSDCFFDLGANATHAGALAFKPTATAMRLSVAHMFVCTLDQASIFKSWHRVCQLSMWLMLRR